MASSGSRNNSESGSKTRKENAQDRLYNHETYASKQKRLEKIGYSPRGSQQPTATKRPPRKPAAKKVSEEVKVDESIEFLPEEPELISSNNLDMPVD